MYTDCLVFYIQARWWRSRATDAIEGKLPLAAVFRTILCRSGFCDKHVKMFCGRFTLCAILILLVHKVHIN